MKVVTVRLLVDTNKEQEVYDGINAVLKPHTSPLGSGINDDDPLILDYSIGNVVDAKRQTAVDVAVGEYQEGSF